MDVLSTPTNECKLPETKETEELKEIIASCGSISHYEDKSAKVLLPQILAAVAACSFHLVVGIGLAYSAILIPQLMDAQNETDSIPITETDASWIASVLSIVMPPGAIIAGIVTDLIGRLNMIKLAAVPGIIGWILIACASNVSMIIGGRVLTGIASSWGMVPAIVYITEISRIDIRGSMVALGPTIVSLGMLAAYLQGWLMHWRLVAWSSIAYTALPVILVMIVPESPIWLVSKDKIARAKTSLEWLNRYQSHPENRLETFAELQLSMLQKEQMVREEQQAQQLGNNAAVAKMKMFLEPTVYKPLMILSVLYVFQQFSGIFIILFYAVTFFNEVGTEISPYLASVFIGVARLVMGIVSIWLMRRFGRRPLVIGSAMGMAVFIAISGLCTKWVLEGSTTQKWIPVALILLYVLSSVIGFLGIPFTIMAELFPTAVRGVAHSIVFGMAHVMMFVTLRTYYDLNRLFGGSSGLQYFFAVMSLAGALYSYVFLPETHKKKLSEIEEYFRKHTTYLSVKPRTIH